MCHYGNYWFFVKTLVKYNIFATRYKYINNFFITTTFYILQGYLVVCDLCGDSYHAACHQPQITEKLAQSNKWICMNCQEPVELKINQINDFKSFSDKISAASDGESFYWILD